MCAATSSESWEFANVRVHPKRLWDDGLKGTLILTPTTLSWTCPSSPDYSFSVALSEISSLRRVKPRSGIPPNVTVITTSGIAYAPLYFPLVGALHEFWRRLESATRVTQTNDDPSVWRVNDDRIDPLTKSVMMAFVPAQGDSSDGTSIDESNAQGRRNSEIGWAVLEGLGSVKKFVSETLSAALGENQRERREIREEKTTLFRPPPTPTHFPLSASPTGSIAGSFEILSSSEQSTTLTTTTVTPAPAVVSVEDIPVTKRERPLSREEWERFHDERGGIARDADRMEFLHRAFSGGFGEGIRRECWKELLGFYPMEANSEQRRAIDESRRLQYAEIKSQWLTVGPEQERHCSKFRERREQILKDVVRTDREYPFFVSEERTMLLRDVLLSYSCFNADVGYVQGMNDLCAVVMSVMDGDEVETFWCYQLLMEKCAPNFRKDQTGMRTQLLALSRVVRTMDPALYSYLESTGSAEFFFCFRWMLVLFKREFSFDTTKRLWEALLSNYLTPHFELFVATAILIRLRGRIMGSALEFDAILQLVQGLSGRMALDPLLVEAEFIFMAFLRIAPADLKDFVLGGPVSAIC